jgi:hypothetical protein
MSISPNLAVCGEDERRQSLPKRLLGLSSFRDYADYALTPPFAVGLARLQKAPARADA